MTYEQIEHLTHLSGALDDIAGGLEDSLADLKRLDRNNTELTDALQKALDLCEAYKVETDDRLAEARETYDREDAAYWEAEDARATREYWREVI